MSDAIGRDEYMQAEFESKCAGKYRHPTQSAAEYMLDIQRRERNANARREAKNMAPYKCKFCGYWHLGPRSW